MNKYMVLINKKIGFTREEEKNYNQVVVESEYVQGRMLEEETCKNYKELEKFIRDYGYFIAFESGYRSFDVQEKVWKEELEKYSLEHAQKYVAKPGHSEHESGLAVDICLQEDGKWKVDTTIGDDHPMLKLLHKSLWKFGFILRYPKGKEDITGYAYEPWHLRYIKNKEVAKYIYDNNLCLEEYYDTIKPVIGIPATLVEYDDYENPYNKKNIVNRKFSDLIKNSKMTPIGLLQDDDGLISEEALKKCDGFLFTGGTNIEKYHTQIIDYAIKNNKPLLGICLGCQVMGIYSYVSELLQKDNKKINAENIISKTNEIKEQNVMYLKLVEGHYNEKLLLNNKANDMHDIKIYKDTLLHSIFEKNTLPVLSLHKYAVNLYGKDFIVNSVANDGVIEGLEYTKDDRFILGIQWHPEFDEDSILIDNFKYEVLKRIKTQS